MKLETNNSTVILLLNKKFEKETEFAKKWFAKSRFDTKEVEDIFQAIEEIDDFTTSNHHRLFLLTVDLFSEDFCYIQKTAQSFSSQGKVSFMALSGSDKIINHSDCFEGSLSEISLKLDKIMPNQTRFSIAA